MVIGEWNRTPSYTNFNGAKPVKPCKLFWKVDQVRKELSVILPPTKAENGMVRPLRLTTKLTQNAMERKTVFGASTTAPLLEKRNRTASTIDVNMEKPVEPRKSSWKANHVRKKPSLFQPPTELQSLRLMTKLKGSAAERKTAELIR